MTYQKGVSLIGASKDKVILVHGLYENRLAMIPLTWRLSRDFHCHTFCYASVFQNISQHSQRLAQMLNALSSDPCTVHFVTHSLGGLVVRHYLANFSLPHPLCLGKVVTLGTPHLGSQVAHLCQRLLPKVLGLSYVGGLDGTAIDTKNITLGVIAGNRPLGIGLPLLFYHNCKQGIHQPHDGTVYVHETKLKDFPHITLPVNHTQLLTDRRVARQVRHFLHYGCFEE